MKMRFIIALLAAVIASPAFAGDKWIAGLGVNVSTDSVLGFQGEYNLEPSLKAPLILQGFVKNYSQSFNGFGTTYKWSYTGVGVAGLPVPAGQAGAAEGGMPAAAAGQGHALAAAPVPLEARPDGEWRALLGRLLHLPWGQVAGTYGKSAVCALAAGVPLAAAQWFGWFGPGALTAGPVGATEYVELLPKARVTGNVSYKSIEIHVGAIVMGQLVYENPQKSDKIVEFKPATGKSD